LAAQAADTNVVQATNSVVASSTLANTVVPVKKPAWQSQISAGVTLTRGNSDTEMFTAKFQTQKKQPQNEWLFEADAAYGETPS